MINDAVSMIAVQDIRPTIKDEPDLVKRIEKAFFKVQDFWMTTDDGLRFNAALAAVISETADEAEKERVFKSKRALDQFDAFLRASHAGLTVDVVAMKHPGNDPTILPLLKMWNEAKDKYNGNH